MVFGQVVETVLSHPSVTDGMCTDKQGNVYTASGGLDGNEVGKYDPVLDVFTPDEIIGLLGPTDVEFLNDSVLIITNYDNNTISAYEFSSGLLTVIATGLDGPGGIETSEDGFIYITNWGGAPAYAGQTITKISPWGTSWTYIDTNLLYRPQAITYNHEGQLVVHSNSKLYKINEADSTLELWSNLTSGVGNIVLREADSCIYGASPGANRILKVEVDGSVSTFAGSYSGHEDGDISDALFTDPLGLTFSLGEDTLYVAEAGTTERLRRIILTAFSGVDDISFSDESSVYPNPIQDGEDLTINTTQASEIEHITIYDSKGEVIYVHFPTQDNIQKIPHTILDGQPNGMYVLTLWSKDGGKTFYKVVKE